METGSMFYPEEFFAVVHCQPCECRLTMLDSKNIFLETLFSIKNKRIFIV